MEDCRTCKRTDVKCCPTCGRGDGCDVYHKCGEDCIGYKPMTQADRIRSMTDEELIAFIKHPCKTIKEMTYPNRNCVFRCDECIEEWLKEKVE